jgi:anti-sigma factor ChrR (cupin superfamily)
VSHDSTGGPGPHGAPLTPAQLDVLALVAAEAARRYPPPPLLRERILRAASAPSFSFVRDGVGLWMSTEEPGAETKQLYLDSGDRLTTRLVRLAAGAALPAPPISGTRSIFVLRGSVAADGDRLDEGDFLEDAAERWRAAGPALVLELAHRATSGERRVRRAAGAPWKTLSPGMRTRPLGGRHDAAVESFLLDIAPDHALGGPEHAGTEELFVIRGSCTVEGRALGRGDYHRAAKGSRHAPTATAEGCLLFVSLRDPERLAA